MKKTPKAPPKHFYSPSTGGFYRDDVHGERKPADCVEITHAQWQSLLDEQSGGKQIVTGKTGLPIAVDRKPTPENVLRTRDRLLQRSDWLVMRHRDEVEADPTATTLTPVQYAALQTWRKHLRSIDENSPGFPDVTLPVRPV